MTSALRSRVAISSACSRLERPGGLLRHGLAGEETADDLEARAIGLSAGEDQAEPP